MSSPFAANTPREWLIATTVAVVTYIVLAITRRILVNRIGALAERTETDVDDAIVDIIKNTRPFFLAAIAASVAIRGFTNISILALLGWLGPMSALLQLLVLLQVGLWISGLIDFLVGSALTKRREAADRIGIAAVKAIGVTLKIMAWIVAIIVALEFVFGKSVSTLVTGLGIGGIAIALAVQNILGDLLAAVAIVFDRPFDVGDSIAVDNLSGTVEQIGLKTTRLRSVTGEQLVIGNAELLKSKLRNYKRMYERRVLLNLDVTYDTPADVIERLPRIVQEIVTAQPLVRFERSHFAGFQESALRIETVYFVLDPDYKKFMDAQQAVNLGVLRRFTAEGIAFAFPTHTVHAPASHQAANPPTVDGDRLRRDV